MYKNLVIKGGYRKYDEIAFLRAFAITTIVLMHLIQSHISSIPGWAIKAASLGGTGVHVFFFCSGLGLYLSYLNKKTTFIDFIKRRFLKIYIPYISIIIILFFLPFIEVDGNRVAALISHIFLYKMFVPRYYSTFGVYWFISTIFQFYFAFIPLCLLKGKLENKEFLALCIATSAIWWILTGVTGLSAVRPIGSFFLQYLWEFSFGMVIADYLFNGNDITIKNTVLIIIAIIGIGAEAVLAISNSEIGRIFNDVPALLGYGALSLLLFQVTPIKRLLLPIDSFSYEWYLLHGPVFIGLCLLKDTLAWPINAYVYAGVIFVLSMILSYYYHAFIVHLGNKKRDRESILKE